MTISKRLFHIAVFLACATTACAKNFVVCVGLSDYPGYANDLTVSARDAVYIANLFQRNGGAEVYCLTNRQATVGNVKATMRQAYSKATAYDTVILFYPIWWAFAPKIMYTFVESQNWEGKNLITLCTSGGSGLGRSGSDLAKYAKGSDFKGGKDFTRGSGADIKKYVEGLLK